MTPHRPQPGTSHKRLYGDSRHPYYVVAPDYQRSSAGIRVMHQFCAALRMCGQEAWMSTGVTGPLLGTPKLTTEIRQQHMEQGRVPIAVYPEVIGRNPLHCHVVTRYILNKPGLLGEKPQYKDSDLLFVYEPELLTEAPSPWGVLHLPSIDTSVFHNRDNPDDQRRHGWCVYAGRHAQGLKEHPALFADCTVITRDWPSTREDMAALFRRSEGVYCFENTAISMEARLCGCPVVQLPSKLYDPAQFFGSGLGLAKGISFSTDSHAVEAARAELIGLSAGYEALEDQFWQGLDQWIHDTQALAADVARTPKDPIVDDTPPDDPAYRAWYQLNAPGGAQAQHLATRMVLDWVGSPSVHLLMAVRPGELVGFEQTRPSLQTQVFDNWMLTVATTDPAPESIQAQPRIQWLQARDAAHLDTILHEMAKVSGGEWLGFLSPGTQLDALGLQALVDAAQGHPAWQLVYCDDDVQSGDGRAHHPRLKPAPDLITLCGVSFLDGLTLMRTTAYASAIQSVATDHAPAYAVALQLLAAGHTDAIGHVDGIWAHLPEGAATSSTAAGEWQAVTAQLRQARIDADVLPRNAAHLRVVQPTAPLAPQPVTALMLGADTLEACLAQWRHLLGMAGGHGLQTCLIANRLASPVDAQLLRTAVAMGPELATTVVELQGLSEGEALAELCLQVSTPLTWVLGPNTVPMQADGLHHLAAWMNWPGVAAVQPGLWDMTAGRMLSPGFAPGLVWEPLALPPETLDNTPTQQRALASLNGEGVLIQTVALQMALQQMSSIDRALWPLALSRQLTLAGQSMVWKPEVMCGTQAVTRPGKDVLARQFLTQNLAWLAGRGAYNPRLSLRKPALVDAQRSTPWLGLPTQARRCLLLQEEGALFPQDHLSNLAQIGEAADASLALWTVSPTDSADLLLLEIVRAGPQAVYFGPHAGHGPLAEALQQLAEHSPSTRRICCIAPLPSDVAATDTWVLLDWLTRHQRALRGAHRALATTPALVEALRPHHPDVQWVESSALQPYVQ